MKSRSFRRVYCDCGHLSIYHMKWTMSDNGDLSKCFGRDRDALFRIANNKDLDQDDIANELVNTEVMCRCGGFSYIKKNEYISSEDL